MKDGLNIDSYDRVILEQLQQNARISMTDLAKNVGLSKTPVTQRVRRLEESGLISSYRAVLSPLKLGLSNVTYVEVRLTDTKEFALKKFNDAVREIAEVEECYLIAGSFDYLLKVRCRDMVQQRQVMASKVSSLPFIASTSSFVAMEAVVENAAIDI